jgi:hypothetical protein
MLLGSESKLPTYSELLPLEDGAKDETMIGITAERAVGTDVPRLAKRHSVGVVD